MPPEKPRNREALPIKERREPREKSGWEKLRGIASDVLDLFAADRKLDELIDKKIEKLPPKKRKAAAARQAEMRDRANRERMLAKGLLLSIGLAVSGAAMSSRENPDVPVPEAAQKALAQVEKPKKPPEENWEWVREEKRQDSTRKFTQFLTAAMRSHELKPVTEPPETPEASLEKTAEELDMDPEELKMAADRTQMDMQKAAIAGIIAEGVAKGTFDEQDARRLLAMRADLFARDHEIEPWAAKMNIARALEAQAERLAHENPQAAQTLRTLVSETPMQPPGSGHSTERGSEILLGMNTDPDVYKRTEN